LKGWIWLESHHSGKRWLLALLMKIWDVLWDQWEHLNGILNDADSTATTELMVTLKVGGGTTDEPTLRIKLDG
jgi:hypothetical protein